MKTVAVIQARMGSTRLPGKVMRILAGKTVLAHVIQRVKACPLVDEVVVATTVDPADDILVVEAQNHGASVFRGSEEDVLSRYYFAAKEAGADVVIRITSDCPLFDPTVLERMLKAFSEGGADYLSNTMVRSYPRGLDASVFTFAALEKTHMEAHQPFEREHVTAYMYQHQELFSVRAVVNEIDLSGHRWTLDTTEDWQLIEAIFNELGADGEIFPTADVVRFLDRNPDLVLLNAHVEQKKLQN